MITIKGVFKFGAIIVGLSTARQLAQFACCQGDPNAPTFGRIVAGVISCVSFKLLSDMCDDAPPPAAQVLQASPVILHPRRVHTSRPEAKNHFFPQAKDNHLQPLGSSLANKSPLPTVQSGSSGVRPAGLSRRAAKAVEVERLRQLGASAVSIKKSNKMK